MKLIGMKCKIALISVAVVCLLMAPAFSAPSDSGAARDKQYGKICSMANITPEQMGNMTLGEIREMRQQAWGNSTACAAGKAGQNCSQMGNHTMAYCEMRGDAGKNGADRHRDFDGSRSYGPNYGPDAHGKGPIYGPNEHGFLLLTEMDNLTADELNNMTLNQIKDLQQKKMQELGNMTLNQIRELNQKEMQAQNNMTLNDFMAKEGRMPGMGRFMDEGRFQGRKARS
jgi:hypothetical protein